MALAQFIATYCGALFAGAALYITVAEHPARMLCETRAAVLQWAPSYKRATFMQVPLAFLSATGGLVAWLAGAGVYWLVGAILIGAVIPFTLLVIMPTNRKLLAQWRDPGAPETRKLLERWGSLHAARSALSLAASAIFAWRLVA